MFLSHSCGHVQILHHYHTVSAPKKKNEESENSDGGEREDEAGSDRLDIYGEASVGVRLERTRVTELFLEIFHYLTVAQMMLLHA